VRQVNESKQPPIFWVVFLAIFGGFFYGIQFASMLAGDSTASRIRSGIGALALAAFAATNRRSRQVWLALAASIVGGILVGK
jgi:RsiW-degrading membrane proteinase PrsW (M82 family)